MTQELHQITLTPDLAARLYDERLRCFNDNQTNRSLLAVVNGKGSAVIEYSIRTIFTQAQVQQAPSQPPCTSPVQGSTAQVAPAPQVAESTTPAVQTDTPKVEIRNRRTGRVKYYSFVRCASRLISAVEKSSIKNAEISKMIEREAASIQEVIRKVPGIHANSALLAAVAYTLPVLTPPVKEELVRLLSKDQNKHPVVAGTVKFTRRKSSSNLIDARVNTFKRCLNMIYSVVFLSDLNQSCAPLSDKGLSWVSSMRIKKGLEAKVF